MKDKGSLSRGVGWIRESVKTGCRALAQFVLKERSYPLVGIPWGLAQADQAAQELYPEEFLQPPRPGILYPNNLKNWNFGCAKVSGLSDHKRPHISNIGSFMIAQSRELSRQPKSNSSGCLGIDPSMHWRFEEVASQGITVPAVGLVTIKPAIATTLGGSLTDTGRLITTYLQSIEGRRPHEHTLFRFSTRRFFPRILDVQEPVLTLTSGWQGAFYHWIHEVIPRFHLLEQGGHVSEKIYIESHTSFQKESLALLGISPSRIIPAQEYAGVRTPQLIVPATPSVPTEWGCRFLRERFLPQLQLKKRKRLYVTRCDAERRRVLNEEALEPILRNYGFEVVALTSLSLKEQMEEFYAAEVVVGPHGAGFSHLVFCQPGTPFLEFFSPAYTHLCYWHLAHRMSLPYYHLFGEGAPYPAGVIPPLDPDIHVDPKKLDAMLKKMGC